MRHFKQNGQVISNKLFLIKSFFRIVINKKKKKIQKNMTPHIYRKT